MPPATHLALSAFCTEPLERSLASAVAAEGACHPAGAQAKVLDLFKLSVRRVPAYAAFLEAHCCALTGVHAVADVPLTTKANYAGAEAYPLAQRCQGGALGAADFVHQSSGSTGAPTYWARNVHDEMSVCPRFEAVLRDNFEGQRRSTLAVVAFPLGAWVGGVFTTACLQLLTYKGYKLTTVTPGNNVGDILQAVASLGPSFDQVILFGYPPFLKAVVDAGCAAGRPDWRSLRLGLVLAGEVVSEEWRALMAERCGMEDPCRGVASLFGTADAGVIANETPLASALRQWLAGAPAAARELFGRDRLPTLCQYDPYNRFIERHPDDGTLVVSSTGTPHAAAPLLRYAIGDAGGIASYADVLSFAARHGFTPPPGLPPPRTLPFVWVFGRAFWTVSLYGANVYVENIMAGLAQPEVRDFVTGKFVLSVAEGAALEKRVAVEVELAQGVEVDVCAGAGISHGSANPTGAAGIESSDPGGARSRIRGPAGVAPGDPDVAATGGTAHSTSSGSGDALRGQIEEVLLRELLRLNGEFAAYVPPAQRRPEVTLRAWGDPRRFPPGVKHKYVAAG